MEKNVDTHRQCLRVRSLYFTSALSCAVVLFWQSMPASTVVWNGSTDTTWGTAANWTPGVVPGTGDTAIFSNAGGELQLANGTALNFGRKITVTDDARLTSDRLTAGAGVTHTLGTLSIGAQRLTIAGGSNVTSGAAGVAVGATTFTAAPVFHIVNPIAGGTTTLSLGAVTNGGFGATFTGNGNLVQTGVISGTAGLTFGWAERVRRRSFQARAPMARVRMSTGSIVAHFSLGDTRLPS